MTAGSGRSCERRWSITACFSRSTHSSSAWAVSVARSARPSSSAAVADRSGGSRSGATWMPLSRQSTTAVERKFSPVVASRSSSGVNRRSDPYAAIRSLVTSVDATKAGSSEGNRLPSASQRSTSTSSRAPPLTAAAPSCTTSRDTGIRLSGLRRSGGGPGDRRGSIARTPREQLQRVLQLPGQAYVVRQAAEDVMLGQQRPGVGPTAESQRLEAVRQGVLDLERGALVVLPPQEPHPAGDGEHEVVAGLVLVQCLSQGGQDVRRHLGRATPAQPRQLVADPRVAEPLQQDPPVVLQVDAGDREQQRRRLLQVARDDVAHERVGHRLVAAPVAGEVPEVAQRAVGAVEQAGL